MLELPEGDRVRFRNVQNVVAWLTDGRLLDKIDHCTKNLLDLVLLAVALRLERKDHEAPRC
eukprot:544712-Pleurochrysis_carterae.AAC.1